MSSSTSVSGRARKAFCGAVYISQNVQWFHEQPLVSGRISESASLGGRKTGSTYRIGNMGVVVVKRTYPLRFAADAKDQPVEAGR